MSNLDFMNCYEDARRAEAYASLEFANTYYLAYRDLPQIFSRHIRGRQALDFGCGAGRSTRFVRAQGYEVTGIDVSEQMIARAKAIDPNGDYRLISAVDFAPQNPEAFDLVLSAFTFDNVAEKAVLFRSLALALRSGGALVNLVSSPQIYLHEWASFSTRDFLEQNRRAVNGDPVRIIVTDHADQRPVEDILWTDDAYRAIYSETALEVEAVYEPLAAGDEPYRWINETRIAPWVIYVLRKR